MVWDRQSLGFAVYITLLSQLILAPGSNSAIPRTSAFLIPQALPTITSPGVSSAYITDRKNIIYGRRQNNSPEQNYNAYSVSISSHRAVMCYCAASAYHYSSIQRNPATRSTGVAARGALNCGNSQSLDYPRFRFLVFSSQLKNGSDCSG